MSNEEYQSLFAHQGAELRAASWPAPTAPSSGCSTTYTDEEVAPLVQNLGGHDLDLLLDSYRACDAVADRPSVVFAYTVKGWGLPIAGDPLNHSMLLSAQQIDELRAAMGLTVDDEWDRFDPSSPEGELCAATGGELNNVPVPPRPHATGPRRHRDPDGRPCVDAGDVRRILTRLADVAGWASAS